MNMPFVFIRSSRLSQLVPCFKHQICKYHLWTNFHPVAHYGLQNNAIVQPRLGQRRFEVITKLYYSSNSNFTDDQLEEEDTEQEVPVWLNEEFEDDYLLPSTGHRVAVIQPNFKEPSKKEQLTSLVLQLEEAATLVETLPKWNVVDKSIYGVRHRTKHCLWGRGNFMEITQKLREIPGITAVLVGINMLTGLQLANLQEAWGLPVYDRYTIVLQIFKMRARTREAKLQVALAEIPYFRSRLFGVVRGSLSTQATERGLFSSASDGRMHIEAKKDMLQKREQKIKTELEKIKAQREILKKERERRNIPTIAIVGYTNAGKTSLIRALSGDKNIRPRNQLFATLDVTVHEVTLPNHLNVLLVDTVGFISNIPTELIASFSATLKDMIQADSIVIVNDISHPDLQWQRHTVQETLRTLKLPQNVAEHIIEVNNKADLVESNSEDRDPAVFPISTVTGEGLLRLQTLMQDAVMKSAGLLQKRLRIPQTGQHLSWLYKESTVVSSSQGQADSLIIEVIMTLSAYNRFKHQFGKQNKVKSSTS